MGRAQKSLESAGGEIKARSKSITVPGWRRGEPVGQHLELFSSELKSKLKKKNAQIFTQEIELQK